MMEAFQNYFARATRVVQLNVEEMKSLANDEKSFFYSLWVLILPQFLIFFLGSLAYREFDVTFLGMIAILAGIDVVSLFFMQIFARNIFRSKTPYTYRGFFGVFALSNVLLWVLIIPFSLMLIGVPVASILSFSFFVVGVWRFVVFYKLLKHVALLKTLQSFVTIIVFVIADSAMKGYMLVQFLGQDYLDEVLKSLG